MFVFLQIYVDTVFQTCFQKLFKFIHFCKELFHIECFICGKHRLQRAKKNEFSHLLLTRSGECTIKMASKDKMPSFYYQIKDVDLIAKELKIHDSCFASFTHEYRKSFRDYEMLPDAETATSVTADEVQKTGNCDAVKKYINKHILIGKNAVSMNILHTVYGLRSDDTRYRSKLKTRIKKDFMDKINFLSVVPKPPEIVVDSTIPPTELIFNDRDGCIIKPAEYLREDILMYSKNLPDLSWPGI